MPRPSNLNAEGLFGVFNVVDYGARGDGQTDDTSPLQIAILAAKAAVLSGSVGSAIVHLPPGTYPVKSLDLTNTNGIIVQGCGPQTTRLIPTTSAVHVLDLTGALACTLRDFQIGTSTQTPVPTTAILLAQVASGASNAIVLNNLYVTGKYSLATLYNYGVPSSSAFHSIFYNYNAAGVPTVYFSATNAGSAASTYATVTSGSQSTSDWTFLGCEIHDFTGNGGGRALKLDGTGSIRYVGGNISENTGAVALVELVNTNSNLVFLGTTFYSDTGGAGVSQMVFNNLGTANSLIVHGCSTQASSAIFAGSGSPTYDKLSFIGKAASGGAANVIGNGNAMTVIDAYATMDGAQVNIAAGTITRGLLINPGTITASGGNTAVQQASGGGLTASGLTLAAGSSLTSDSGTATAAAGAATLNKQSGTITSEALTTAAGADYVLTLTNSVVTAASRVLATVDNGTNTTEGLAINRVTPSAGQVVIRVRNTNAATALNGTVKINFLVVL